MEVKHPGLISAAKASCKKFYEEQVGEHGWGLFLKATAGKILWLSLLERITSTIFPNIAQAISIPGGTFIAAFGGVTAISIIWDSVIKDKLPDIFKTVLNGDIAYGLDNKALNFYIMVLLSANLMAYALTKFLPKPIVKFSV